MIILSLMITIGETKRFVEMANQCILDENQWEFNGNVSYLKLKSTIRCEFLKFHKMYDKIGGDNTLPSCLYRCSKFNLAWIWKKLLIYSQTRHYSHLNERKQEKIIDILFQNVHQQNKTKKHITWSIFTITVCFDTAQRCNVNGGDHIYVPIGYWLLVLLYNLCVEFFSVFDVSSRFSCIRWIAFFRSELS